MRNKQDVISLCFSAYNNHNCGLEFSCQSSNQCIPRSKVCDGRNNCGDNSDENQNVLNCGRGSPIFFLTNDFMNSCMTNTFFRILEGICQELEILCHKQGW